MNKDRVIELLSKAQAADTEDFQEMLTSIADAYSRYGALTFRQAKAVFWRLGKNKIAFDPSVFTITLKSTDEAAIKDMKDWQIKPIITALSTNDRDWVESIRA